MWHIFDRTITLKNTHKKHCKSAAYTYQKNEINKKKETIRSKECMSQLFAIRICEACTKYSVEPDRPVNVAQFVLLSCFMCMSLCMTFEYEFLPRIWNVRCHQSFCNSCTFLRRLFYLFMFSRNNFQMCFCAE